MQFSDLIVNGIVVKQETQINALKLFLKNESRQAKHLETFLEDLGVPTYNGFDSGERLVSMRVADRVLQTARKCGIIVFSGGRWLNGCHAESFLKVRTP